VQVPRGAEIERRSMQIIEALAGGHGWTPAQWAVVRRMVHASADLGYVRWSRLHPKAVSAGIKAIKAGARVFADSAMVAAGLSRGVLKRWAVEVVCLVDQEPVWERARAQGLTRAEAAVDMVVEEGGVDVVVIGNSPTALARVIAHWREGRMNPRLVIGIPVGFVGAAEAKMALVRSGLVYITALGAKGGAAVAAAAFNALGRLAGEAAGG